MFSVQQSVALAREIPTARLAIYPDSGHAFMMYPVVLRNESKTNLVEYLEARGIETRDMLPLINQPVYKKLLGTREEDYPIAQWINRNGFYVGCHQDLTKTDLNYMIENFNAYFGKL